MLWLRRASRSLLGTAGVTAFFGVAATVIRADDVSLAGLEASARGRLALAFGPPWDAVAQTGALALGLAVILQAADVALSRKKYARSSTREVGLATDLKGELLALAESLRGSVRSSEPDVVTACDDLIKGASGLGASDIHVSPTPQGSKVTLRVQGELRDLIVLPGDAHAPMVTRLKVLSRLDTYIRNVPQDGRLVLEREGGSIEARVSTLPTELGERVVLRLVRGGRAIPEIESLGFPPSVESRLSELLGRPQGTLFVTGPVGSGKTTTLYACLAFIARSRSKTTAMVTLEDPIELELPFATQTQIHPKSGMTFAGTLRSVLRQDPNVLMVGEIRDKETAEIATQAGLTGHLILTTVHGQSSAGVFARLVEMGIEPFLLASSTLGCVSQRLARALCPACRKETPVEPIVRERFEAVGVTIPAGTYFDAKGCESCDFRGFVGRVAVVELLVMDEELRAAVNARMPSPDLARLAEKRGMVSLLSDGIDRAKRGETSLMEVLRVAG